MKKDTTVTLRMSLVIKDYLQEKGYSMQRIFDSTLEKLVKITTKESVELKNEKKEKKND